MTFTKEREFSSTFLSLFVSLSQGELVANVVGIARFIRRRLRRAPEELLRLSTRLSKAPTNTSQACNSCDEAAWSRHSATKITARFKSDRCSPPRRRNVDRPFPSCSLSLFFFHPLCPPSHNFPCLFETNPPACNFLNHVYPPVDSETTLIRRPHY